MDLGELLTRWTIRLALLCYVVVLAGRLKFRHNSRWETAARAIWTAGCLLFVCHVASAFHFYHHWSHQQAYEDTARQTHELLGWQFGGGIYFSYAFALLWVADTAWWWFSSASYRRRPVALRCGVTIYMLFIALNGAIVFEDGPVRWAAVAACVVLIGLFLNTTLDCWHGCVGGGISGRAGRSRRRRRRRRLRGRLAAAEPSRRRS